MPGEISKSWLWFPIVSLSVQVPMLPKTVSLHTKNHCNEPRHPIQNLNKSDILVVNRISHLWEGIYFPPTQCCHRKHTTLPWESSPSPRGYGLRNQTKWPCLQPVSPSLHINQLRLTASWTLNVHTHDEKWELGMFQVLISHFIFPDLSHDPSSSHRSPSPRHVVF